MQRIGGFLFLFVYDVRINLLENGVDIYTIKSLMGHTNVKTTQIYTHIVNEQKEKAANTLHIENLDL